MSTNNISNNNIFMRTKIEQCDVISSQEKAQILSIFDKIDEIEEDNQKGTITTSSALNKFLCQAKDMIKEKFDKFIEFINSSKQDENVTEASSQKSITRESQYEKLASSLNIEYDKNKGINPRIKEIISSGYIDSKGNVTNNPDNIQLAGRYTPTTKDLENMQYVFGKTQFADNFSDHNQMLDAMEYAKKNNVNIEEATILINCDTHSDIYLETQSHESIADWVNTALAKNSNLTDFYWVVSDNMAKDSELGAILNGNEIVNDFGKHGGGALFQNIGVTANLNEEESIQTYYISPDGYLSDFEEEGSRPIKIHITTEKNLPDFSGQKVITTFDMDYFSNSGVDTVTHYRDNKSPEELNKAFSQILQTFADHNIQPIMHGNCYSDDDYLPKEDYNQAQDFSNAIINATPQKDDMLNDYKRKH